MKIRTLGALVALLMAACGGQEQQPSRKDSTRYGGLFNLNETEPLRSIFPLTLTQSSAFRIASQVYQGLTRIDPNMSVQPALAESWTVDATSTIYTFSLRKQVRFHDDPAFQDGIGREMTADDVVACFNAICTRGIGDQMFWLFQDRVIGANARYGGGPDAPGVKGIEKVDAYTVRITLTAPTPNFLRILAHQGCWIWPHELTDAYPGDLMQHAIGTGPFKWKTARPGEAIVMERNPDYWDRAEDGSQLPYLDGVRITFAEDKNREIDEFFKGHVSAVLELPVERMDILNDSVDAKGVRRFHMLSRPLLSVQFYGFNRLHAPFNDIRVRRAFALAIDRRFIVDSVLKGVAVQAEHGIVAPGLPHYPYELVPGFHYMPDTARALMAAAGYPGGRGFPALSIQVNNDGFGYERVAGAVQEMLQRELGVAMTVSVLPADQHYERIELCKANMWREGWIADHPDPENFLALLYGKNAVVDTTQPSSINNTRFRDPGFDELFRKALGERDEDARNRLLAEAEAIAMKHVPVAPLYHERALWLLQPYVRGLTLNSLEGMDLSTVWLDRAMMPAH
jgi:oligopeptide transport system substrate-binding protein